MTIREAGEGIGMLLLYSVGMVLRLSVSIIGFGLFTMFAVWFTRLVFS